MRLYLLRLRIKAEKRERLKRFNARKTCDKTCAANYRHMGAVEKYNTATAKKPPCLACEKALIQRENEKNQAFLRRVHCDNACSSDARLSKARVLKRQKVRDSPFNSLVNLIAVNTGRTDRPYN